MSRRLAKRSVTGGAAAVPPYGPEWTPARPRWSSGKLIQRDRIGTYQFKDASVLGDFLGLLQVQGSDVRLEVDDVRILGVVEVQDPERAGHRGVRADRERQHPDLDVSGPRGRAQVLDLRLQNIGPADRTPQRTLAQHRDELRRRIPRA